MSCHLPQLVMRLLLTCQKPIDYQGYIYEHEESFSNFADRMAETSDHVSSSVASKHFQTSPSFNKMGFLSIVLLVFSSLHFRGFIKTDDDSFDLSLYFGYFCNGTVQLVKVWQHILTDKVSYAESLSLQNRNCFWLLERADLKVFLQSKETDMVDPMKWNDKLGNSQLPRFQFNIKGPAAIKQNLVHIRASIKRILKYRLDTPTLLSNKNLHDMFVKELSNLKGIGSIVQFSLLNWSLPNTSNG